MKLLLSVAALLVMTTELALAQQKKTATGSDEQLRRAISADTNMVTLAAIESVQKNLGVGEDVARKLTLLGDEYQEMVRKELETAGIKRQPGQRMPEELRLKTLSIRGRVRNDFIPKTKELFTVDQARRLRQIWLQASLKSGPMGVLEPDVAWELELTDDQKQALNSLNAELREKQFPGGQPVKGSREAMAKLLNIQEEYAKKAADVLTAEQKDALGKEFPFPKLAR
jgi:hypothetical protein